jgi:FHA domain
VRFGSSSELDEYESDAGLTVDAFRKKHGDAFLLIEGRFAETAADASHLEDATDENIRVQSGTGSTRPFVFPVSKRTNTEFNFIAIGRNVGNDIHVPHPSVSRFHAFFRPSDKGGVVVQDAKSSTGITLDDRPVPKPTEGEPLPVPSGSKLRFGAVVAQFVDAAGLLAALRASGSAGLGS